MSRPNEVTNVAITPFFLVALPLLRLRVAIPVAMFSLGDSLGLLL
jgi:hypothetical protein